MYRAPGLSMHWAPGLSMHKAPGLTMHRAPVLTMYLPGAWCDYAADIAVIGANSNIKRLSVSGRFLMQITRCQSAACQFGCQLGAQIADSSVSAIFIASSINPQLPVICFRAHIVSSQHVTSR